MNAPLKNIAILHLAHWDQLLGGAEQQLKYLAEFMHVAGFNVHVIFPDRNKNLLDSSPYKVYSLGRQINLGVFGKSWFLFRSAINIKLREINPDIIITRTYSSFAGIAAEYAEKYGKTHIHFIASDSEVEALDKKVQTLKIFNYFERYFFRKVFNGKTRIICQNQNQHERVKHCFAIDAIIQTQSSPEPEKKEFLKNENVLTVLWVANLKPLKRPEKFFAIAKAFANDDSLSFVMIGADHQNAYHELIQQMTRQSNFTYLGQLSNDKVNEIMETSHVLVNTSDFEGFSNTFVQAWMREMVVLSLHSNPDEILTRQGIGYCINDIVQLIACLETLAKNPEQVRKLGKNARKYALKNHSLQVVYKRLLEACLNG